MCLHSKHMRRNTCNVSPFIIVRLCPAAYFITLHAWLQGEHALSFYLDWVGSHVGPSQVERQLVKAAAGLSVRAFL